MFLHSFKYSIKTLCRSRMYLFWCGLFPILLATLFKIAFGNLSESEDFDPIKTAVVVEEGAEGEAFVKVIEEFGKPGKDQFLDITYATKEEALKLLEEKKISGILYGGEEISLTVSAEMDYDKLNQSILQAFVERFRGNYNAIIEVAKTHPRDLAAAAETLSEEAEYNKRIFYPEGNMDESLCYFFNLIAMACLFGCTAGAEVAIGNQANLSALAMRKGIAPVRKPVSLSAEIMAAFIVQFAISFISILYIWLVLKVDMGSNFGYVMLSVFAGCLEGVSFGFLIGCIGKISKDTKTGILMGVTMCLCFLSGLMVQGMRILVERVVPFANRINPAALISDSLYSLVIYESHTRYAQNIVTLLLLSLIFCVTGMLVVRRERYASL